MLIFLICLLIYISLGIPDGIISSVWPVMSSDIDVNPGFLGLVGALSFGFSFISVVLYPNLMKRFNLSIIISTSIILLIVGFGCYLLAYQHIYLILGAIFIGLGGGGIDTGINEYAIKNFDARKINILHAFYAIGVSVGAFICSIVFWAGQSWEFSVALVVFILLLILLIVIIFRKVFDLSHSEEAHSTKRVKGAYLIFSFYFIYAIEIVTNMFISSYVYFELQLGKDLASFTVFMFWIGLFLGRMFVALITKYLKSSYILILSIMISIISAIGILLLVSPIMVCIFSFGIGFGFGPIYPTMLSEITSYFKEEEISYVVSKQMLGIIAGGVILPMLAGIIFSAFSYVLLPVVVIVAMLLLLLNMKFIYKIKPI